MPQSGSRKILDPTIRATLLECLREGVPIVHACGAARISEAAYHNAIREADEPDAPPEIVAFVGDVKDAIAAGIRESMDRIRAAGRDGNWTADAWLLERRYPRDFARKTITELSGPEGKPVNFILDLTGGNGGEDEDDG